PPVGSPSGAQERRASRRGWSRRARQSACPEDSTDGTGPERAPSSHPCTTLSFHLERRSYTLLPRRPGKQAGAFGGAHTCCDEGRFGGAPSTRRWATRFTCPVVKHARPLRRLLSYAAYADRHASPRGDGRPERRDPGAPAC